MAGSGGLRAQTVLAGAANGEPIHLFNTDLAVLEAGEPRTDLPCTVTPDKPVLGFDLRFHAGYDVTVPLKELVGPENLLTILFRVVPAAHKDSPIYFTQRVRVPSIEADAHGSAFLQGSFDLGAGDYHVDWLMRDRGERVCSFYWDSDAALSDKDKQVAVAMVPGTVQASAGEEFKEDPPIERLDASPLDVKVLVNFAPQNPDASTLQPSDTNALVSILRQISRDPHIGKFSLVAFNMQEQKVVYRQEDADRIDFPALGEALASVNPGLVNFQQLSQKHGDTDFLAHLIKSELAGPDHPDALIFAGPKVMLDSNVSQEDLKAVGAIQYPVFYMNYDLNPQAMPWRDAISRAVRYFKGTEYTISRPRDLWFAVNEMVSRIVKSKHGRQMSAVADQ
jgi:hypothetical protein